MENEHLIYDAESIEIDSMKSLSKPFDKFLEVEGNVYYKEFSSGCIGFASSSDVLFINRVIGAGLAEKISGAMLRDIIKFYKKVNCPRFFIQIAPEFLDKDAKNLLNKYNAVYYGNWVKSCKEAERPVISDDGIEVRIAGPEDKERISEILLKSFSFPPAMKSFCENIVNAPGWTCFVALIGGKIAGTGSLFMKGDIAELGVAATDENFRGKGIQSKLISVREKLAYEKNCSVIFVETLEPTEKNPAQSFRNMMRYGFKELYRRANYLVKF